MKAKDYLITWLWTSLLMYFLYDVVWVLADHEEFNRLLEEGCTILWIDLCYCFLFSIYNLGFGTLLLKPSPCGSQQTGRHSWPGWTLRLLIKAPQTP